MTLYRWIKEEWLRPEEPELVQHLRHATWVATAGTLGVPLIFIPLLLLTSQMPLWVLASWMSVAFTLGLGSLLLMRLRPRDNGAVYQLLMVSFWMFFVASLELYPNQLPVQEAVNVAPLAVAVVTPRRVPFFLGLLLSLLAARSLVWLILLDYPLGEAGLGLTLSLIAGIFALVGAQLTRKLWSDLMKTRQQLLAADRLSALGQHTAGIAHELKSPLASALNEVYSLRQLVEELSQSVGHPEVEEEDLLQIGLEMEEHLEGLAGSLERSAEFVRSLRKHTSHMNQASLVSFSLYQVLQAAQVLLAPRLKHSGLRLEVAHVPISLLLRGDPDKLEQVVFNLVTNALDACQESHQGTTIQIQVRTHNHELTLVVQDDGPGVPPELREKIFEPLFTTRAEQSGTGLGLSVCRDIAEGIFGGSLHLEPLEPGQGARFVLRLPLREGDEPMLPPLQNTDGFVPFSQSAAP